MTDARTLNEQYCWALVPGIKGRRQRCNMKRKRHGYEAHPFEMSPADAAAAEADTLRQRVAALTDVDWLAQVIRSEDPKHDLGAAALAERIIARAALAATPTPATDEAGG